MATPLWLAILVAAVFYALLPVLGAYSTRSYWRRFRARLVELGKAPLLHLGDCLLKEDEGDLDGARRFFGRVEAIQGSDLVWIKGEELTALVDLKGADLHVLADGGESSDTLVSRTQWKRVHTLPEGGKLFVGGAVRVVAGKPVFRDTPAQPLVAVSYEGPDPSLLSRLVSGGRRSNEYWNPLARASIAVGIGLQAILLVSALGGKWLPTIVFLAGLAALAPLVALLPPGLPFFFIYLRLWRSALRARVQRDACALPLRFFTGDEALEADGRRSVPLPEGGTYVRSWTRVPPPPSVEVIEGDREADGAGWTIFTPELSTDPWVRRMAIAGVPELRARDYARRAFRATLGSGFFLFLSLAVNAASAFALWRYFLSSRF